MFLNVRDYVHQFVWSVQERWRPAERWDKTNNNTAPRGYLLSHSRIDYNLIPVLIDHWQTTL